MLKRTLDLALSSAALIVLSPLIALVALLVRVSLGRPVLFRQQRPGANEVLFEMIKFRTMRDSRSSDGELLPDRERLTRFGATLRRTSLDELPELINVIRGEMSIVGPRPLLPRYTAYMSDEERTRYSVRPGITGWAQVNGRNLMPWDERLEFDVWYVKNASTWIDIKIIWWTLVRVISRRGVVPDAGSIMMDLDVERKASDA